MDSVGRNMLHVGPGVHTLRCTRQERLIFPWMHATMSLGWRPSNSTSSRFSQDERQAHDWSVCLTWSSSLLFNFAHSFPVSGSKQHPLEFGFQLFFTISRLVSSCSPFLAFDLASLPAPCPDSTEEASAFWKFLHTFQSECGKENKTNPVTQSGAWS